MVVVACGNKNNKTTTKKTTGNGGTTPGDEEQDEYTWNEKTGKFEDKWGKEKDDLPDDLKFLDGSGRNTVINILTWSDVEKPDFENDEDSEDERMSSIYYRNRAIQNRLGVTLEFDGVAGDSGHISNFVSHVETAQQAGTNDFDIIATYSRTAGALTTRGLLVDVNTIENSYLTVGNPEGEKKPWWPKNLSENMAMGTHLFMLAGDISITVIDEVHCIYFNKDLINIRFEDDAEEAGVEDGSRLIYKYVREGDWTIDKLLEMASNYYVDNNGSGRPDKGDKFGLCSINYCATALYGSANFRMLQADATEILKLSPDFTSTRMTRMVQKVGAFMTSNDYYQGQSSPTVYYMVPFTQGECLFGLQYLEYAEDYLINNDAVEEYGLVPCPKYNSDQLNYYSVIGNAFTVFGIFADFDARGNSQQTLTMLSAVLECWASEGYRKCTPIVFELNMQLKYSQTQDETDMCEYVRAGIMFDLGRVMASALGDYRLDNVFINACINGTDWASSYESMYASAQASLQEFLGNLRAGTLGS